MNHCMVYCVCVVLCIFCLCCLWGVINDIATQESNNRSVCSTTNRSCCWTDTKLITVTSRERYAAVCVWDRFFRRSSTWRRTLKRSGCVSRRKTLRWKLLRLDWRPGLTDQRLRRAVILCNIGMAHTSLSNYSLRP